MMEKRSHVALLLLLAGSLLMAGCGGEALPTADEGARRQVFLMGNGAEPKTLDPHLATGVVENHVIAALSEGLISYHPTDDEEPEPGVAERWEVNGDFSQWTFFLRPDARWSNGDALTAEDFVYSFRRILTAELGAQYAEMLYVLRNAEAYHEGRLSDFSKVGVKAVDPHTLTVDLIGPTPYFLNMLKHYTWFPVHRPTIEAHGGLSDRSGAWTRPGNHVGNGPFVLNEWKPDQYLKVAASETYWDHETVRLNAIIFFPIDDLNTEKRMFLSGRLHLTGTVPTNDIANLRERSPEFIHIDPYLATYYFKVNVTRPPLDKPKVRAALSWAIDRKQLVDTVTLGEQLPARSFVPALLADYPGGVEVGFDPEKARALLAEAGHPDGQGIPPLDLLYNTQADHRKIAEALGGMWKRHLNIDIRPLNKEWQVYLDDQSNLNYDLSRAGWVADYPDAITFLSIFTTGNGNNKTGWSQPEYDRLIDEARRAPTQDEHTAALRAAEDILMAELPIIPIYWYTRIYLKDPRLQNWHPKALDNHPYKYLYFEAE